MIPIVFDWHETQFGNARGFGTLTGCTAAKVTEEINGAFTLEMQCFNDSENVENLAPRNIIWCKPSATMSNQAFRIVKTKRTLKNQITVYANHISYDLTGIPCLPFTATGVNSALSNLHSLGGLLGFGMNFTFRTNVENTTSTFKVDVPSSVRSWFGGKTGSIIDVFGGEWEYNNFYCTLKEQRGVDNNIRISYGVNLANYEKERENMAYTHVMAFVNKSGTITSSDPQETGVSAPAKTMFLNITSLYPSSTPTKAQLDTYAQNYIDSHKSILKDTQTIKIDPFLFEDQVVGLGDTVHVAYGGEMADVRVVKTVWDVLADRYSSIEMGVQKQSIATTIKNLR